MGLRTARNYLSEIKLTLQGGYNAKKYWENRHSKFGLDLRGVGNKSLTVEENQRQYREAGDTFLSLCKYNQIEFQNLAIIDIGCGNGYYTQIFKDMGCSDYTGIDITDVLFPELKKRFPNYKFKKCDITKEKLSKKYDLIIMIDVSQHITAKTKFQFAMNNVKNHMSENGFFIVTSFLEKKRKNSFYEKSRGLDSYKLIFNTNIFCDPKKFRDKYIFVIEGN